MARIEMMINKLWSYSYLRVENIVLYLPEVDDKNDSLGSWWPCLKQTTKLDLPTKEFPRTIIFA